MLSMLFRLLLAALTVILFQNHRFALALFCLVLFFIDLMRTVKPIKYKLLLLGADLSILALLLVIMYHFNLNNTIEDLRFKVWEQRYQVVVEELLPALEETGDVEWNNYRVKAFPPLALGRQAHCRKRGDSIIIHFSTFLSFFTNGGFVYFTDEAIEEYFGDPANFTEHWAEADEKRYDYVRPYNENWAYIILY